MIAKYGSETAVREFMSANSNKSTRNQKGTGGFAWMKLHDPEKLKQAVSKGGRTSSRAKEQP